MHRYDHRTPHTSLPLDLGLEASTRRMLLENRREARFVFEKLDNWMRVLSYSRPDLFAVRVIVHEALSNAFRHGHGGDPTKFVHVRYLVTPEEVLVEVRDEGPGFDPDAVPSPLGEDHLSRQYGRGLLLMRAYASWVSYNRAGNQVTLCRRRSDEACGEVT
jgi:serine/threonine-protein kinase RsbW